MPLAMFILGKLMFSRAISRLLENSTSLPHNRDRPKGSRNIAGLHLLSLCYEINVDDAVANAICLPHRRCP